jgi:hypothetical protein
MAFYVIGQPGAYAGVRFVPEETALILDFEESQMAVQPAQVMNGQEHAVKFLLELASESVKMAEHLSQMQEPEPPTSAPGEAFTGFAEQAAQILGYQQNDKGGE